jgi:ATP/maltotriose-dependent transcriptional regulator MalT
LWAYWRLRSRAVLGRRLTEEALKLDMPTAVRAAATNAAGSMAYAVGDLEAAADHWRETERLARLADLPSHVAAGVAGPGLVALSQGDPDLAERQLLLALSHAQGTDAFGEWLRSILHVWSGAARHVRGDLATASERMQVGLDGARSSGDRLTACVALLGLGQIARATGERQRAREHLLEGLRLSGETGDLSYVATFLQELSVVASASGEHHRAAVLQGACEAVGELSGGRESRYRHVDEDLRVRSAALTREALGEDAYDDTVDAGRSLTTEERSPTPWRTSSPRRPWHDAAHRTSGVAGR